MQTEAMSYCLAKRVIKKELGIEGLDPAKFGINSLGSGRASRGAALGMPERLFQRHGGWRSEKGQNNHVRDS